MIISLNDDDKRIRLLALMLNWNVITGVISSMGNFPGLSILSAFSSITILFSLVFVILTVLLTIESSGNWRAYLILVIWIGLFAVSYLINPGIAAIAPRAFIYFATNVFCIAALLQSIPDLQVLVNVLKRYIPITVFYALLQWTAGIGNELYSMSFSYATIVTALLCMLLSIKQKEGRLWNATAFLILFFTNFRYGSRGAFICYALALMLNYCYSAKKNQVKTLVAVIAAGLVIFTSWENIISMLVRVFPDSRNVIILTQGIMLHSSGRGDIYRAVINEMIKNPFAIRGLYSDRYLLAGLFPDVNILWGSYTHNFILELLYQFGLWSLPAIIILAVCMIKAFVRGRWADEDTKIVFLISYAFSIGQLLISSSYLISPSFGLLIGILLWSMRYWGVKRTFEQ